MTNVINLLTLSILTTFLAVGQLLFKRLGGTIRGMGIIFSAITLLEEPIFYVALLIYGVATLLWIWVLGRVSLMQAYPWVGVGVIVVPLLSSYFYGEKVAPPFWVGAALITVGIVLTQYSGKPG